MFRRGLHPIGTARSCIYSFLLGIGSALVGFVIGLIIRPPSTTISSILIVIGLLFVAGAILFVRQSQKPKRGGL